MQLSLGNKKRCQNPSSGLYIARTDMEMSSDLPDAMYLYLAKNI